MKNNMARVSKANPCPICNHPDWCLVGESAVLCMRVVSTRTKLLADGDTGYLHPIDGAQARHTYVTRPPKDEAPFVPARILFERWSAWTSKREMAKLADSLGVSVGSLVSLMAVQRDKSTWAFPMRDADCNMVGLRIRSNTGAKFASKGSHGGLFIPEHTEPQPTVFLPEGPTSTAAALTLGLFAIGRPSANSCILELARLIRKLKVRRAVILADTDTDAVRHDGSVLNAGNSGAEAVSAQLGIPNCILTLPCKDMRVFVSDGGDRATLDYLVKQCVWRHP